jgi:Tol biopolymer transport system component
MKDDESKIDDIIRAIASGSSVDWDSVSATSSDDSTTSVLKELRVISRIAEVHESGRSNALSDDASVDTLQSWGALSILEQLGRGSYGNVFRALDSRLDRDVALKLLKKTAERQADAPVVEEGRLLARIRHPNVVTVHGADRIDGRVGIWMELIDGKTLDQIVRENGPMSASDAVTIGLDVCRGLAAVHNAGLVHRDIKAQNVMRQSDGRLVLMDFGTGRAIDIAQEKSVTGTPLYLAPEVLAGAPATRAGDIYSVGVLLYYLLTRSFPVTGQTLDEVRRAHIADRRAPIRSVRPDVPRRLAAIINRATDPSPSLRFARAAEMEAALRRFQTTPRRLGIVAASVVVVATTAFAVWAVDRSTLRDRRDRGSAPPGIMVRQVDWPFDWFLLGEPSADGRWLSFTDGKTGNVAVLDLRNGSTRLLTNDANSGKNRYVTSSAFSADGRQLACGWYRGGDGAEVRIIDLTSGRGRTLFEDNDLDDIPVLEWSHDGSSLVARVEAKDKTARLELLSVGDGARRVLKTPWPSVGLPRAVFSADDQFVVYDEPSGPGEPRDLHIIHVANGRDAVLLSGPTDDGEPMWAGANVLFTSNRGQKRALWRLPVAEGRAAGVPTLVSDQLAIGFWPVGLTSAGSVYYGAGEGVSSVYTTELASGIGVTTPERVTSSTDPERAPEWSPDGRTLIWIARSRVNGTNSSVLTLRNLDTGQQRTLPTSFSPGANPRWSPDGTRLLVRGPDGQGDGLRLIDIETGRLLRSYLTDRQFGDVEWAKDGASAFFMDFKERLIGRLDIQTGAERVIYRLPGQLQFNRGIAISPDGDTLAFNAVDGDDESLYAIPVVGGRARRLLTLRSPQRLMIQEWTRDGRQLLFVRSRQMAGSDLSREWQLWSVDREGGEPHYLDLSLPNLGDIRPNPDGRRLAFSSSNAANRLRVVDNLLSTIR